MRNIVWILTALQVPVGLRRSDLGALEGAGWANGPEVLSL